MMALAAMDEASPIRSTSPPLPPGARAWFDGDSGKWIAHAQEASRTGTLRLRRTSLDNAPYGREIHWHSGFLWWLRGLGTLRSGITTEPLPTAIAGAAHYANPLLACLFITFGAWLLWRRWGLLPAAVFAMLVPTALPLAITFLPNRPDHHGLITLSCLAAFGLPLLTLHPGRLVDAPSPLFWMLAALAGAIALWVSAATATVVLALTGLGMLAANCFASGREAPFPPLMVRGWAAFGAAFSLAFYLIEYAPFQMGMRLEVNHPLYAFAWLGGAEVVASLSEKPLRGMRLLTGTLGLAILPFAIFAVGSTHMWHVLQHPVMFRLHELINEFAPPGLPSVLTQFGLLIPLLVAGLWLITRPDSSGKRAGPEAFYLAAPTLPLLIAYTFQERWSATLGVVVVAGLVTGVHLRPKKWIAGAVMVLCLFNASWITGNTVRFYSGKPALWAYADTPRVLAIREIAATLYRETPTPRLIGNASLCGYLNGYGIPSVASQYWENLAGIQTNVKLFSTSDPSVVWEVLRTRKPTHLIVQTPEIEARVSLHCAGEAADDPSPSALYQMLTRDPPDPAFTRVPLSLPESAGDIQLWRINDSHISE